MSGKSRLRPPLNTLQIGIFRFIFSYLSFFSLENGLYHDMFQFGALIAMFHLAPSTLIEPSCVEALRARRARAL
jgi:hypothetical protein